jgi:hypothetical protein
VVFGGARLAGASVKGLVVHTVSLPRYMRQCFLVTKNAAFRTVTCDYRALAIEVPHHTEP